MSKVKCCSEELIERVTVYSRATRVLAEKGFYVSTITYTAVQSGPSVLHTTRRWNTFTSTHALNCGRMLSPLLHLVFVTLLDLVY